MTKKLRCSLLLVLMMSILMSAIPVQAAAGKKTKAMKAYSAFLRKKTVKVGDDAVPAAKIKFAIAYINNDNVPELIVRGKRGYFGKTPTDHGFQVYTFKKGKVKKTKLFYAMSENDPMIDASIIKYYKKKNCVILDENYAGYVYANINGKRSWRRFYDSYYISSREGRVTKKEFEKALKKMVGSKKAKTVKYYKNTKANRRKVLK